MKQSVLSTTLSNLFSNLNTRRSISFTEEIFPLHYATSILNALEGHNIGITNIIYANQNNTLETLVSE